MFGQKNLDEEGMMQGKGQKGKAYNNGERETGSDPGEKKVGNN